MKILVLSDLHIEFAPFDPVYGGVRIDHGVDLVVLAGDIHVGTRGISWARQSFPDKAIVYVPGNHEFYRGHWLHTLDALRVAARQFDVSLLEDDVLEMGGYRFLGTTLWTDFELFGIASKPKAVVQALASMADFRVIQAGEPHRGLSPQDTIDRHITSRTWLTTELAKGTPEKTVVITHHLPSMESVALHYRTDCTSAAFGSNLEHLLGQSTLWIHGHTHDSFDYVLNGTRIVCNPRGYPIRGTEQYENRGFKLDKVLTLPTIFCRNNSITQ